MKKEISYLGMAESIRRLTEPAVHSAISALDLSQGSRGLDAGCGVGNHTLWLAEEASPGGHVTGVDISEESIRRAKKALRPEDLQESVSFLCADLRSLPFGSGVFDWAWCADTLWIGPEPLGLPAAEPLSILNELGQGSEAWRDRRPAVLVVPKAFARLPAPGVQAERHMRG
ncbi:MAG: class I SAM-dependent methyltransferase [Methanotrichaceae archaeon]|nr:class I SAM-dependent methyltransferase [Methanotrichaceae archaeon]